MPKNALACFMKFTTRRLEIINWLRTSTVAMGIGISLCQVLTTASYGDVIILKNGKRISVERSWEEGNKLRYEKDGNVFGFSKDLVEKVETGTYIPDSEESTVPTGRPVSKSIPIEILHEDLSIENKHSLNSISEIIKEGKADNKKLGEIENEARLNPRDMDKQNRYRSALMEVINWQFKQGEQADAMRNLQQYLRMDPGNLQASIALGSLYLRQGQYLHAEDILSQAQVRNNDSSELYYLLGATYYLQDRNGMASRALRRSLELGFRPEVDHLLKKIEEENWAENAFKQANSLHFVIKYEGTEGNEVLGREILLSLERSFTELESALNYSPRESISVVLYTGEVFRDVTRTPNWVGAINDGKIRLPIKGLSRLDDDLRKILKHELTHSFLRLKTAGTCPVWLNEGLAQYEAGDSARQFFPLFKQTISENNFLQLKRLEGPFVHLPYAAASWAYQESLVAVEFLVKSYGLGEIRRLLEQSVNSADFETTLRTVLRKDYAELQRELQDFVTNQ